MITFEYMQELSSLNTKELENRVYTIPEEEARELLYSILYAMYRHDRKSMYDIVE